MDHHDDWAHWSEEPAEFGDADTADLGDHDMGHPDDLGHPEDVSHPDDFSPPEDFGIPEHPGPDLLHDGDDALGLDAPHEGDDALNLRDDAVHEDFGEAGHDPDQPAFGDPDVPDHDPGGYDGDFPPPLDLGHAPPEPMDGYPWSDPATLGDPSDAGGAVADQYGFAGAPHPDDLFAYAGLQPSDGGDAWSALLGSDDPATSALARWWGGS
jgi:hypothetical protein